MSQVLEKTSSRSWSDAATPVKPTNSADSAVARQLLCDSLSADNEVQIQLDRSWPIPVLAVGAERKNTLCLGHGSQALIRKSADDLTDPAGYRQFVDTFQFLKRQLGDADFIVAHDLHPLYLSSVFARQQQLSCLAVQHHHAHAVSCAVDAGISLPVIAVVCDGAGYGVDGASWGGEILLADALSCRRLGHLRYMDLPGGDAAARAPWRSAVALLAGTFGGDDFWTSLPVFHSVDPQERDIALRQLRRRLNAPRSSSLGRLFDGVAFLAGVRAHNDFEGHAAVELQRAAGERVESPYPFDIEETADGMILDWQPLVRALATENSACMDVCAISARFHATIAAMFDAVVARSVDRTGVNRIVLSGGCFANDLLRRSLVERLRRRGLHVGFHAKVPTGDGGLSLGQAVVAGAIAASGSRGQ